MDEKFAHVDGGMSGANLAPHPLRESAGHVHIVPEVANEVAGSQVVDAVELVVADDEVVAQRARDPLLVHSARVLGEEYRQIGLTRERILDELNHNVA